ncbi:MAG: hypothetical protein P4L72_00060 [Parvibaculum sp.]|nr:hypothetical protein [Parvibaculum sp.]MDR3497599.1 hypothetical protein [Parvibaculum sp.]
MHLEPGKRALAEKARIGARHRVDEAREDVPAEGDAAQREQRGERRGGGGKGAPAARGGEHQRNEQAELRLVGERAEEHSGDDRAAVEQRQRAAGKRRRQQSVLADADAPEKRGRGQRQKKDFTARQDRAHGREIGHERRADPERGGDRIGEKAERRDGEEKERRIEKRKIGGGQRVAELAGQQGDELRHVIGGGRMPFDGEAARGPIGVEVGDAREAVMADDPQAFRERLAEHPEMRDEQTGGHCHKQMPAVRLEGRRRLALVEGREHRPLAPFGRLTLAAPGDVRAAR